MDLTDEYENAKYVPDAEAIRDGWEADSRDFRAAQQALGRAALNLAYGPGERERWDLFMPAARPEGLMVFVHGGYWRLMGREWFGHLARGAMERGWGVAMPSYPLAPDARIGGIAGAVRRAVLAACARVPAGPLVLTGHSAGGHLAARTAEGLEGAARDRLSRVVPISPVSDLRPLMRTAMNADLGIDPPEAAAESPALRPAPGVPGTVWVGSEERPAFLDQARWLADAWGWPLRVDPGRHHFDVVDGLADPGSPLMDAALG
ncbi:alpha/beta hydrolase family protein [Hasllibacter halocynthiae]|uniref:Alpha/beta hydrolase family protein n=1 Tax=Hasllibacter halocynthiae TaxID=595589 RepID=A0A2T0X193_9RHOB|nr:alpha/beta hydrolase [Hasllibacter halocynthiae]PRY92716.1 alpha/beta hydrolase family protein [Hasllibacter halocynthiae]